MASTSELGVASFFGGLARGISGGLQRREQAKQNEKDQKNQMIWKLVDAGIQQGQDPQNLIAWGMQQTGVKDPKGIIAQNLRHASKIVPQMFDPGQSPGRAIGLQPPGGGPSEPAATGPQASPGRSVALQTPVQDAVPTAPVIPSQDELTARQRAEDVFKSNLEEGRTTRTQHAAAVDRQELAQLKQTKGAQVNGEDLPDGTLDSLGRPVKHGSRYQAWQMGDGQWSYEPMAQQRSPSTAASKLADTLSHLPENAGKSQDQLLTLASQQLQKDQQLKSRALLASVTARGVTTALGAARLKDFPLTSEALQLKIDAMKLSNDQKTKINAGDPKSQVDFVNQMASQLLTNPESDEYQGDFHDVADKIVKEHGFGEDYEDLMVRAKQAPQPVTVPDTSGGTAGGQKPAASQPAKGGVTPPAGAAVSVMRAGKSVSVADGKYQAGDIRTYPNGNKAKWDGTGWLQILK